MKSSQWNNLEYIKYLIKNWKDSDDYKQMLVADRYYEGNHDILKRRRITTDADGIPHEIVDLPNNKIVDNIYHILVNQKRNYCFGKPFLVSTEKDEYQKLLDLLIDDDFRNTILDIAQDTLNHGIAWLHPFINEHGEFELYNFRGYEIIPVWKNNGKKELLFAVRVYTKAEFDSESKTMKNKEYIEVYCQDGVFRYENDNQELKLIASASSIKTSKGEYNWTKCPLIAFRYTKSEKPLLFRIKSLQDALNSILSTFMNIYEEDPRSSLMVVMNYDGEDRETFKRELAQFGTIFLSSVDGVPGDVKTLTVEVNPENFKAIQTVIEKRLYSNGGGFDAKFDKLGTAPNEMNIQSIYSDIDLDSNTAEMLFKSAIKQMLWFYNQYLILKNKGDYTEEPVKIVFKRDILINETQTIQNISASAGTLSLRTILEKHPFVENVDQELKRIQAERQQKIAEQDPYESFFSKYIENQDL